MTRQMASSSSSQSAAELLTDLQTRLCLRLESLSQELGQAERFASIDWLRDGGLHGGGQRLISVDGPTYNRAAINYSQIHYPDLADKALASATALSTIVHPHNPFAPSMHMHLSWTELKSGRGYWRLMADLNPSIPDPEQSLAFATALEQVNALHFAHAIAEGDRYFYIPTLERHRGVFHFYLEAFASDSAASDFELARQLGEAVIQIYPELILRANQAHPAPQEADFERQIAYHSLYFLQVLTLDRGTTSGLLVHNQNDIGILGSLPARVNRDLLASWLPKLAAPQDQLMQALLAALPAENPSPVSDACRADLAQIVRQHYLMHPEALALQARASVIPPTLANHLSTPS